MDGGNPFRAGSPLLNSSAALCLYAVIESPQNLPHLVNTPPHCPNQEALVTPTPTPCIPLHMGYALAPQQVSPLHYPQMAAPGFFPVLLRDIPEVTSVTLILPE